MIPKPSIILSRYRFLTAGCTPGEFVIEFLTRLLKLAEHCEFQPPLNDKRKVLADANLGLKKAIEIALSLENAEKRVQERKGTSDSSVLQSGRGALCNIHPSIQSDGIDKISQNPSQLWKPNGNTGQSRKGRNSSR